MLSLDLLIFVSLIYVAFLFGVAFWAERASDAGRGGWMRTPLIYTLSLSIYCTAWTFYGAVGFAARSGLEFLTIYLGPTVVLIGWWLILRRLVRIARAERITSIADLVSSRFGKSALLGGFVTVFTIYDMHGRKLSEGMIELNMQVINLEKPSEGLYYLEASFDGKLSRNRFLVSK